MRDKLKIVACTFAGLLVLGGIGALVIYDIQKDRATNPPYRSNDSQEEKSEDGFPLIDWQWWQSINPDVVAWITIPGTDIDYPIVQARKVNPEYYLSHDVYGNQNFWGAIYLDADCLEKGLFNSRNTICLGHHLDDGSMFTAISNYVNTDFTQSHNTILIQTPTEKFVYHPIMVRIIEGSEVVKVTNFPEELAWKCWIEQERQKTTLVLSEEMPSSILTLCTCSYYHTPENERTLVYCAREG